MEHIIPVEVQESAPRNAAQEKWGGALQAGFQVVPNILIQAHKELELDPLDVLILLNLNMHWWSATALPFPRADMMAERIGVTKRTVERRLQKMQKAGLIKRMPAEALTDRRQTVNRYNLSGLVKKLTPLAAGAIAARGRSRLSAGTVEDSG